jgi:hypothetical protein
MEAAFDEVKGLICMIKGIIEIYLSDLRYILD